MGEGETLANLNKLEKLDLSKILREEWQDSNIYNPINISSLFHDTESLISSYKNSGTPLFLNINIQSLNSKFEKLSSFLLNLHNNNVLVDLVALQETWSIKYPGLLSIPGYQPLAFKCRTRGRGGGVGFYIREGVNFKIIENLSPFKDKLFESLTIQVTHQLNNTTHHHLACNIYRSPSPITGLTPSQQMDEFITQFDNLLHDLNNLKHDAYVFMDSNINLLNVENDTGARNFMQTFTNRGFLLTNFKATRVQGESASLIDNILTNSKTTKLTSGSLVDDMSDHFMIFLQPSLSKVKSKPKIVKSRAMTADNIDRFKAALGSLNWNNALNSTNVDDCYDSFWDEFKSLFDIYLPLTTKKFSKNVHKISDFMTGGLLISRKNKLALHKIAALNPSQANLEKYKRYRNLFNSLVRASKKLHYANELSINKNNPKKLWDSLKTLTTGNTNCTSINQIESKGKITNDKLEIAEEFNQFFTEAGKKIANSVNPITRQPEDFESPECPLLSFNLITQSELLAIINKMEAKSSTDINGISMKLLKEIRHEIALPLTHLFNLSISTGTFPSKLKTSRTIPIYKAGNPLSCDNYRPISLLSSLSKILEKIISIKLVNHLEINHLLHQNQYGFQHNKSTIHHLLHLTNHIAQELNSKQFCIGVFLDLKKAFDVVSHNILLKKLEKLGIKGLTLKWFESYLSNRKQCVEIGGVSSSSKNLDISVLQGSILGPILFLCFINDLSLSTVLLALLFADDTIVLASGYNLPDLINHVNEEMQKLANWFRANRMAVNISKTKYMIFRPKGQQLNLQGKTVIYNNNEIGQPDSPELIFELERCFNDNPVKEHRTYKLLGVYFDEHLSFDQHVQTVCSKISQSNFIISRAKNFLDKKSLKMLYSSMVHPHLIYCLPIYGCTSQKNIAKLSKIQKKVIRTISKSPYNAHTHELFQSLEILPIEQLIKYTQSLLIHAIYHKHCPPSLQNTWTLNNQRNDNHNLRNSSELYVPLARTEHVKKLTLFALPKIWNNLPDFKSNPNKIAFKRTLKTHLLNLIP